MPDALVFKATIPKQYIITHFPKSESEIIVDYTKLQNIERVSY